MYRGFAVDTPLGQFNVIVNESEAVVAAGFDDSVERTAQRNLHGGSVTVVDPIASIAHSLRAYFAGDADALAHVPVTPIGSPAMQAYWARLHAVPAASTVSYAQLGGEARNARAAASACARNPIPLFVPCHRVVRTGGELGGFYYGLEMKRWLLE